MTSFLIDLGIIGIVVFCAWRGFRNGLIRGVFGVLTLIVSLFLANTIARAYADEFTGVLTPFASGIVESTLFSLSDSGESTDLNLENVDLTDVDFDGIIGGVDISDIDLSEIDFGDIDLSDIDLDSFELDNISLGRLDNEPKKFMAAYLALRQLGMTDAASTRIARVSSEDASGGFFPAVVGNYLSLSLSYIAIFAVSFLLISIIFAVIGNLIGVVLTLPGLRIVDSITGIAFGLVKGLVIVLAIGVVVRYFGLLVHDILNDTTILRHIANNNILANILGV